MDASTILNQMPSRKWPRIATFISVIGTLALGFYAVEMNYGGWMVILANGATLLVLNIWYHRHKSLDINRILMTIENILGRAK